MTKKWDYTREREANDRDDYEQEQADRRRSEECLEDDDDMFDEIDTWTESLEEEARLDYIAGHTPGFTKRNPDEYE